MYSYIFVILALTGLAVAVKTNPTEQSFRDEMVHWTNTLLFVPSPIRNPVSESHLNYISECYNRGTVRTQSLGVLSLIWIDNYSQGCDVYKAQCSYLKPGLGDYYGRILDVGMFGRWLIIPYKMKDFDINPDEWGEVTSR